MKGQKEELLVSNADMVVQQKEGREKKIRTEREDRRGRVEEKEGKEKRNDQRIRE